MTDWHLKITILLGSGCLVLLQNIGERKRGSEVKRPVILHNKRAFFLQPFTGGESQIVSLWADKSQFSLTFRQEGRVPWQKQCIAMVKETDPTWSQNWLLPATVPLLWPSPVWGQCPVLSHPVSSWSTTLAGVAAEFWWLQHPLFTEVTSDIFSLGQIFTRNSHILSCSLKDILLLWILRREVKSMISDSWSFSNISLFLPTSLWSS